MSNQKFNDYARLLYESYTYATRMYEYPHKCRNIWVGACSSDIDLCIEWINGNLRDIHFSDEDGYFGQRITYNNGDVINDDYYHEHKVVGALAAASMPAVKDYIFTLKENLF